MQNLFETAVDFSAKTALKFSGKYKQLSGGDCLTIVIVIIFAIMMPQSISSIVVLGALVILLTALRRVAEVESKPRRGATSKNA